MRDTGRTNGIENVAILLSGGVGTRITSDVPKQYVRKDGVMMITCVLRTLMASEWIDGVVIVSEKSWREEILSDLVGGEASGGVMSSEKDGADTAQVSLPSGLIGIADPGENRQQSIINALEMLCSEECWGIFPDGAKPQTVLIHDAARPYLSEEMISACFEALGEHDGVLPVLPMKDTVYLSRDGKAVSELIDRSEVFAGQAPELFRYEVYLAANRRLSRDQILRINGSTEPAVMAGMDVVMIPGDERNSKVTTDVDMEMWACGCDT